MILCPEITCFLLWIPSLIPETYRSLIPETYRCLIPETYWSPALPRLSFSLALIMGGLNQNQSRGWYRCSCWVHFREKDGNNLKYICYSKPTAIPFKLHLILSSFLYLNWIYLFYSPLTSDKGNIWRCDSQTFRLQRFLKFLRQHDQLMENKPF